MARFDASGMFQPFSLADNIRDNQAIQLNKLKIGAIQGEQERQRTLKQMAAESTKPVYEDQPTYSEYQDPDQQFEGEQLPEGLGEQTGTEQVQTGTEFDDEAYADKLKQGGEMEMAQKLEAHLGSMDKNERDESIFKLEGMSKLMYGVKDEESYNAAEEEGVRQGFMTREQADSMEYSEENVQKAQQMGQAVRDLYTPVSGRKPTAAEIKTSNLIAAGVDPYVAMGIGNSTYRQVTDDQGNISIYDLRRQGGENKPLDSNEAAGIPSGVIDDATGLPSGPRTAIISKGTKEDVRKERQAIVAQQKLDKEHESIKDDLVKQGDIGGLDSSLVEVEKIMASIGKEDIPGFGLTAKVPDLLISEEGKNLRGAVASVFNRMLKLRSGAAVTDPELRRLMTEFGKGAFKTDDQLREGLKKARLHLDKAISNIAAGYTPEAINSWDEKSETLGNTKIGNRGTKELSDKRKRLEYLRKKQKKSTESPE